LCGKLLSRRLLQFHLLQVAIRARGFAPLSIMPYLLVFFLMAQGPSPETAAPLFPHGGYVSYNSIVGARPSRPHEGMFIFAAGLRRDLQISTQLPLTTSKTNGHNQTSLGESVIALKYRLMRLDSNRGTTQASVTAGPRFPSRVTASMWDWSRPVGTEPTTFSVAGSMMETLFSFSVVT